MGCCDELVQLPGQFFLIQSEISQIKIQPTFFGTHRATGHGYRDQGTEQMHAAVHPHVAIATLPVDAGFYDIPGLQVMIFICQVMENSPMGLAFSGIGNN